MKILVVGSGGREAALVWKLAQSPTVSNVYCAPGNAGIKEHATCVPIKATDIEGLLRFAQEQSIDLTVVGSEAPLVEGIVDRFQENHLAICGPSAQAAQTEGSKSWFKHFLFRHNIPTAACDIFSDRDVALAYIKDKGPESIVIKADGLMGGKGVILPADLVEAEKSLKSLMVEGSPGETVVIEDRLVGLERSVMAITDGREIYMFPFTQDYKRVGDGDKGPNTGGMGAHTLSLADTEQEKLHDLLLSVVHGLARDGCLYSGFIYLGVMMTEEGPMVLECNCRLGDPETQAILPSIDGDFAELCTVVADGNLQQVPAPQQIKQALCVVLASQEYPKSSKQDGVITGMEEAGRAGSLLFHAGTALRNGEVTTNKAGRIISVVGVGDSLLEAHEIAYAGVAKVNFLGKKYRRDIGKAIIN